MRIKTLASDRFVIVAVMVGNVCPVESFIASKDKQTRVVGAGFVQMLNYIAEHGFQAAPSHWSHEANKELGIYELIKGNFRLFYFKGIGNQIAVCSDVTRKAGRKADSAAVQKAAEYRQEYFDAQEANTITWVENDEAE